MAKNLRDTIVDDGILECCICTETLRDPRTLPCGHSLCLKCLQNDSEERLEHSKYPCPYCRHEMEIPPDGIVGIGCNVMIKNLVDLLEQHKADHPCSYCHNVAPTFICITCEGKRLCATCEENHRVHTTSHNIVSLVEFREGKHDEAIRALQSSKCAQHNERYKYYCKECKLLLCTDCVNLACCRHSGESRCQISVAHEMAKSNLSQILDKVDNKLKILKEIREEIEKNDGISSNTLSEEEQAIKNYYRTLMEKLIEKDTQDLRKMHARNQAKRNELKMTIQTESTCFANLRQKLSKTISYSTPTEALQLEQPLIKEVQDSEIDNERPSVPGPFVLRYVPTYPECAACDVSKVSAMLGGVAQCVGLWNFKTQSSGKENASDITGLSVHPNGDVLVVDHYSKMTIKYSIQQECATALECESHPFEDDDRPLSPLSVLGRRSVFEMDSFHTYQNSSWTSDVVHVPNGSVKVSCAAGVKTFRSNKLTDLLKMHRRALGLALTSKKQLVVTVDKLVFSSACVQLYSPDGELEWTIEKDKKGKSLFECPLRAAVNSRDDIIVTDMKQNAVFIIDKHGDLVTKYYTTLGDIKGVCVDKHDYIYVASFKNDEIFSLTPDGKFHRVVLSKQDIHAPYAIAFDTHDRLLVTCRSVGGEQNDTMKVFNIAFM